MIQCPNCGYENNPDDALSCNLCGKVFRKEIRKEDMSKPKKQEYGSSGLKSIGGIIKEIRESKGDDRVFAVISFISMIAGYVGVRYFHKITNYRFDAPGIVGLEEYFIIGIICISTLIILSLTYFGLKIIFIKIFKNLIKRSYER